MSKRTSPLDSVRVAAPCSAGWDNMVGTERVRFCGQCNLNVYNLSAMTKSEAERLLMESEGRLCVRYYRRADGTILTKNCPVGLRALKRRLSRVASATASAILGLFAGLFAAVGFREGPFTPATTRENMRRINDRLPEERATTGVLIRQDATMDKPVMGNISVPQGQWSEGQMKRLPKTRVMN
jgi:hypothetical protein